MEIVNEPMHDWRGELEWLPGLEVRVMGQPTLGMRPYTAWRTLLSVRATKPDGEVWIFTNAYEPGELTEEYLREICSDPDHPVCRVLSKRMSRSGVTRKAQA